MEEKYVLEEQLRTVMDRFRYKKNKMRDHQQDIMVGSDEGIYIFLYFCEHKF